MNLEFRLRKILRNVIANHMDGITMSRVARDCEVPISVLSGWMAGASPRNLSKLARVARYLDVSLYYLLFGVEDAPSKPAERGRGALGHSRRPIYCSEE